MIYKKILTLIFVAFWSQFSVAADKSCNEANFPSFEERWSEIYKAIKDPKGSPDEVAKYFHFPLALYPHHRNEKSKYIDKRFFIRNYKLIFDMTKGFGGDGINGEARRYINDNQNGPSLWISNYCQVGMTYPSTMVGEMMLQWRPTFGWKVVGLGGVLPDWDELEDKIYKRDNGIK